jgi:hypothetical protein
MTMLVLFVMRRSQSSLQLRSWNALFVSLLQMSNEQTQSKVKGTACLSDHSGLQQPSSSLYNNTL